MEKFDLNQLLWVVSTLEDKAEQAIAWEKEKIDIFLEENDKRSFVGKKSYSLFGNRF
jgi:hypothetical protein